MICPRRTKIFSEALRLFARWMTVLVLCTGLFSARLVWSQSTNAEQFEKRVLPVFTANCFQCHSSKLPAPRSGLVLDTKAGLEKGGVLGNDVVAGKPRKAE